VKVGKPQDYVDHLYTRSHLSLCPKEAYMGLEPYHGAKIPPGEICVKIDMVRIILSTPFEFLNHCFLLFNAGIRCGTSSRLSFSMWLHGFTRITQADEICNYASLAQRNRGEK